MQNIVDLNKKNKRMEGQIAEYKQIISIIKANKHFLVDSPEKITFDWSKVLYAVDLWVTDNELNKKINSSNIDVYLDKGIKKSPFENLNFNSIHENIDSKNSVGIRITDLLVAIAGNYIKSLHQSSQYDRDEPEKIQRLSEQFFALSKNQFNLLKLMNRFFFSSGQYSIVTDTFFDDEIIFESFLNYIDKFATFEDYQMLTDKVHVQEQFKLTVFYFHDRWSKAIHNDALVKKIFGSTKNAVELGLLRPL